ncbi:YbaB/EbfC family nucleoid-associated protein [Nocardia sp. NBC_01503]|uniref:YbaB/EbfC family nucleoid-associated protein n=1 Tax=Nocardia sp. NBC_01503 TaxID=2975997 RepID=UPI002E7B9980|nr:YbaB/EbfC family nucleoid-associated protein [Nocardia sp. NBC_01503]WTL34856.1 YbaB/EbfC family nucleoid-associated protein [Nocardia sp. NBC_01503]
MITDPDHAAARREYIQNAISRVRGQAQTSGGAVVIEVDMNGTITDLHISQSAMSVEPGRLANAISQCHETARLRAEAEVTRVFAELVDSPERAIPKVEPKSEAWEEPTPVRITHSM